MIHHRRITPEDQAFLYRVYASTREEELAPVPWTVEQKEAFLTMQFNAQHYHYHTYYNSDFFNLILQDDVPIGRLYIEYRPDEIHIVDIALLPEYRGRGIGGKLLRDLLEEGQQKKLPVRIYVEHNNPALHLYERLAFKHIEDQGIYYLMEWRPHVG